MEIIEDRPFDANLHATPRHQCGHTGCGEKPTVSRLRRNSAGRYSTRALCDQHAVTTPPKVINDAWRANWGLNGSSSAADSSTTATGASDD